MILDEENITDAVLQDVPRYTDTTKELPSIPISRAISQESISSNFDNLWADSKIGKIAHYLDISVKGDKTLLNELQSLFSIISLKKKRVGVHGPKEFISKLKSQNEVFAGTMQQDAHEMINYLINDIAETLALQRKEVLDALRQKIGDKFNQKEHKSSWIQDLFQGLFTNETKCLNCECITSRDETFIDLSLDIESNSSLSTCLREFSKSELLSQKDKFFCDTCNSLQEAQKRS